MVVLVAVSECTRVSQAKLVSCRQANQKVVQIHLTGAVESPGVYCCAPGTTLGKLLKGVKLLKNADRKRIEFKKILLSDQEIEVPSK